MVFFLFFPENRIRYFMQQETICMKCQILFSGKNIYKKIFQNVVCWIFTQSAKRGGDSSAYQP